MANNPRIAELLEAALDAGRTPEEVCADAPELLEAVREGWERCQRVGAEIDAIFPDFDSNPSASSMPAPRSPSDLPNIPGYSVESVLGRGGMGVVYKARDLKLNRTVAIKMLLAGPFAASHDLTRLLREAEAEAAIGHPNIVQIYDFGELNGLPYFTMEYLEGGTLAQKLNGVPLPAREAAAILVTLAGAVFAAHKGGVVHRDLKPSNVLLTEDGIPKIADFGLARRFHGDVQFTLSGARVGTPSYMAPEQAACKPTGASPSVDIYTLGAILYEMLTGRPPFRAETALETQRQVVAEEPVPPSRLNAQVPRDLETICLKCLRKEPEHRYPTAAALADDLERFREGRPIQARPVGMGERLWRWARRKPAAAALAATVLALVGLALGGGLWLQQQQAERRVQTARRCDAVEAALSQAAALEGQDRWPEARAVLEGAPSLLDTSAPPALGERLRQARADAAAVTALEEIRLRLSEGGIDQAKFSAEQQYANAFQNYGIAFTKLEPAEMAARIRASPIRDTLLAYLHDWLFWVSDKDHVRLQAVLDQADDDPWRRAFRNAQAAHDSDKLIELATAPAAAAQPPVLISGLAGSLADNQKDEAIALLRDAQQRYPDDFWINYLLAHLLEQRRPQEAIGYYRAAIVIRPRSDRAYLLLGRTLGDTGETDQAIVMFRKAIALNPNCAAARDLAKALAPRGGLEEARAVWQKALEHDPPDYDAWYGYAQLCLFLGKYDEYHQARKALLERFADVSHGWIVAERTSLAGMLDPDLGDESRRALELADQAIAAGAKSRQPDNAYLRFLKGLAEYRRGRFAEAIPILKDAAGKLPDRAAPRLVLAMAQFRSGSTTEARKSLAVAVRNSNWEPSQANHVAAWVNHIFRREAEAEILPNLPAFLQGKYEPRDNDERFALVGICEFQGRYSDAARLFADAFTAEPDLAEKLSVECLDRAAREGLPVDQAEALNSESRYLAARCAALAGCGLGLDGANLSEAERARWRKQSGEWLRADLAAWKDALESDIPAHRNLARRMLLLWKVEPDLARLREPDSLKSLPADEAKGFLDLWRQVDAVLSGAQESP